ncbi:MAG: PEP-CTERM sorting domain-containing protein [Opitutales bacterium]
MRSTTKSWITLLFAAAFSSAHATVLVDFGDAKDDPTDPNWNNVTVADSGTYNLTDTTGAATGINISFGGAIQDSGSGADQRGNRTEFPSWADSSQLALQDRLFATDGTTSSMTISGLDVNLIYDIELFSAYDSDGIAGIDAGNYEMTDADGLVEGFNVLTNTSLGTDVAWVPDINGDEAVEGWLGWFNMKPNASGEIILNMETNSADSIRARNALSAMQLTAVPEPSAYTAIFGLAALTLVSLRRRPQK